MVRRREPRSECRSTWRPPRDASGATSTTTEQGCSPSRRCIGSFGNVDRSRIASSRSISWIAVRRRSRSRSADEPSGESTLHVGGYHGHRPDTGCVRLTPATGSSGPVGAVFVLGKDAARLLLEPRWNEQLDRAHWVRGVGALSLELDRTLSASSRPFAISASIKDEVHSTDTSSSLMRASWHERPSVRRSGSSAAASSDTVIPACLRDQSRAKSATSFHPSIAGSRCGPSNSTISVTVLDL